MDDESDSNILNHENQVLINDNIIEENTINLNVKYVKDNNLRIPSIMLVKSDTIIDQSLLSINKQFDNTSLNTIQRDAEINE